MNNLIDNTSSAANDNANNMIKILCQNVRSINDELKKQYFKFIKQEKKIDILILTETWEESNRQYGIEKSFPLCKTIKSTGTQLTHKGNGIAVIIDYPLAQHVVSYTSIPGRLIRIILKYKKRHSIALYAIQAPTAPYGAGAEETNQLNGSIIQLINDDVRERRRIIFCGDLNSYAERCLDYIGPGNGQTPSAIINSLLNFGLIDIFRALYPEVIATTFQSNNVSSRLDQFWISPQLVSQTIKAEIWPCDNSISDHSAILLKLNWNNKRCKSSKFQKTIWNNENQEKLSKWAEAASDLCNRELKSSVPLRERAFRRKFTWLVNEFKRFAKKTFWIKKRGKRNEKPPIWLYTMRKLRKAERLNSFKAHKRFIKVLEKYFPDIDPSLSFSEIRRHLKSHAQKLIQKEIRKKIKEAVHKRFQVFSTDISRHLDSLLERKTAKIDTSFIRKDNEFICEVEQVRNEFFNYYKQLFGSNLEPEINESDNWVSNLKIAHDIDAAELKGVLDSMANNKASGISGLLMEMIKFGGTALLEWIKVQFNFWIQQKKIPKIILKSQIWLIPKGTYSGDISNTRPINLIEALRKLFSSILAHRIHAAIKRHNILKGWNFGFMAGRSTADAVKILQLVIEDSKVHHKPLVVMFLDIRKAYDSVHPMSIMSSLRQLNFDKNYWDVLKSTFNNRKMRVLTQAGSTEFFHPTTGLEQGDPSSPILWNIFYEPLLQKLHALNGYQMGSENISYLAYADDLTLIASNDYDMQQLLDTVTSYLNFHCMQIQPKKSTVVSNFPGKEYVLNQGSQIECVLRVSKREIITYLGVSFSLLKNKNAAFNIVNEVNQHAVKLRSKRISSSIASYIVNSVLIPVATYRLLGQFPSEWVYKKLENIYCGVVKRSLDLPRSYPHALLQSTILPMGIRNLKDVHQEQEIGNLLYWLNSNEPTSIVLKGKLLELQKCHPIWSGSYYTTKSKYCNDMWNVLESFDLECTSMEQIHYYNEGKFVCQFYNEMPHDNQANTLSKYNITKMSNLLQSLNREVKFKRFESIASKRDIRLGLGPPATIQGLYHDEKRITEILQNGVEQIYKDILKFEREIEQQSYDIPYNEQDFDTVFTDGSFDFGSQTAGLAAVCIRTQSKEIICLSKFVCHCESSTEAEIRAIFLGLILMKKYPKVRVLKTDSRAAVHAIEGRKQGRSLINEKYRFWLTEIRKQIRNLEGFKIEWIKGHANIIGNEIADRMAKAVLIVQERHDEIISEANANVFYLWNNGRKVDNNARLYLKMRHQDIRNNDLVSKSKRFNELSVQLENTELEQWFCTLKSFKSFLNSNFERENQIKFIMKSIGNILPTADHLKAWKIIEEDKCLNCPETETRTHVLSGFCRTEMLNNQIELVLGNSKTNLFSSRSEQGVIVTRLQRTWNFKNAMGIIDKEMLEFLSSLDFDSSRVVRFGKKCIKIGSAL